MAVGHAIILINSSKMPKAGGRKPKAEAKIYQNNEKNKHIYSRCCAAERLWL